MNMRLSLFILLLILISPIQLYSNDPGPSETSIACDAINQDVILAIDFQNACENLDYLYTILRTDMAEKRGDKEIVKDHQFSCRSLNDSFEIVLKDKCLPVGMMPRYQLMRRMLEDDEYEKLNICSINESIESDPNCEEEKDACGGCSSQTPSGRGAGMTFLLMVMVGLSAYLISKTDS